VDRHEQTVSRADAELLSYLRRDDDLVPAADFDSGSHVALQKMVFDVLSKS
jgi:hypothetical protein